MNIYLTLIRREWLQHRFGWMMLALVPLALALLGLQFGNIQAELDDTDPMSPMFPLLLAMGALGGGAISIFTILSITSLFLLTGLARRDHADRSVEFWLSLPTSHSASLGMPLLTHLLLVPAVALLVGLAGGWLVSGVLVTRMSGFGAWLALPWGDLGAAALAFVARVLAGLPLAVLWAAPLLLAVVLANAYLKRWGLPALLLGVTILGWALDYWFLGQGTVWRTLGEILRNAGHALVLNPQSIQPNHAAEGLEALRLVPSFLAQDYLLALKALLSPLFAGCVLAAAALFAALVDWRRRGASAAN